MQPGLGYYNSSSQFSHSAVANSLRPHGLHQAKLPCLPPTLVACSNPCPSNHLILCCPLFFLTSIFTSIRGFSNESALCIRWPKCWSFSNNPSNEYLRLISFGVDWFDLLAVQGTLKSLLQHHSLKASILWHSTFFMVQLSYPYMTAGKTIV